MFSFARLLALLVGFAAVCGCVSRVGVESSAQAPPALRICDIQANKSEFIGKEVTLTAEYSTDSSHYEFLRDRSCTESGMLDIGFVVPERDASVEQFKTQQKQLCQRRGTPAICVLEGKVTVRGVIAETVGAHLAPDARYLVINLHSVISAEFVGEP